MESHGLFVVGVDGPESAAADLALRLAKEGDKGVFLFVLAKVEEGFLADPFYSRVAAVEHYMAADKAQHWCHKYETKRPGWSFVQIESSDSAGKVLVDYAHQHSASMIVLGQSSSLVDRIILGSNAVYAIRNAGMPVLVAKPPPSSSK